VFGITVLRYDITTVRRVFLRVFCSSRKVHIMFTRSKCISIIIIRLMRLESNRFIRFVRYLLNANCQVQVVGHEYIIIYLLNLVLVYALSKACGQAYKRGKIRARTEINTNETQSVIGYVSPLVRVYFFIVYLHATLIRYANARNGRS